MDVGGIALDNEFHRQNQIHRPWHSFWNAGINRVVAESTFGHVGEIGLENRLILRRERCLLSAGGRLGGVIPLDRAGSDPLALEGGIFAFVK